MDVIEYFKKRIEKDPKLKKMYEKKDYENLLLDIGNEVERERIKNKMRQIVLAKKLKTSQSYISRLENGSLSPSLKKLHKIAEIFGGYIRVAIQYDDTKHNNETFNESCYYKMGLEEKSSFSKKGLQIEIEACKSSNKVLLS